MLLVIVSIKIKLYNVINRLSYYKPLLKSLIKYTYLVYLLYVYNKYHYFFFSFFCFRFSFGLSFALDCCSFLPLSFFPLSPISESPYYIKLIIKVSKFYVCCTRVALALSNAGPVRLWNTVSVSLIALSCVPVLSCFSIKVSTASVICDLLQEIVKY